MIGSNVSLCERGVAAAVNHALPQHMLSHWDSGRAGHHPREILVEGPCEYPEVDRCVRPETPTDELGVPAVLAASDARDAIADGLAVEERRQLLSAAVHSGRLAFRRVAESSLGLQIFVEG